MFFSDGTRLTLIIIVKDIVTLQILNLDDFF